jgi:AraC-like DNA-binding protein
MRLEVGSGWAADGDEQLDARFELVSAQTLELFPELVRELGGVPEALLPQARINPAMLGKRGAVISYRSFVNVLELAAAELQCPDFGLRLAVRQRNSRALGPIGVVMKNSETLGQALGYCKKHIHAYCLATRVRFEPDRANRKLFVGLEILLDKTPEKAQALEHGLLLASLNVHEITGGEARARQVFFQHQPVSDPGVYRAAFGCEVVFGRPANGIVITEQDLLRPVVGSDDQVYEIATSYIDAKFPQQTPPIRARVRSLVAQYLGSEDCTNERVASDLCMHARTLQRRLRAEGASFESIKDDVRRELALRYLRQDDMPFTRVAEKLGYAETSVLSRSCYRWFSATPRELRRAAAQAKSSQDQA